MSLELNLERNGLILTPVTPRDHPFLYEIATSKVNSVMWRYHGQMPPFEVFVGQLWQDVCAQFVVRLSDGQPVGHVIGYAANFTSRHVHLGIVMAESTKGARLGIYAMSLFIDYLFAVWDFRGVFLEVPDFVAAPLEMSGRLRTQLGVEHVGRRPGFHYFDGEYYDDHIYYLSREAWKSKRAPVRASLGLGVGPTAV